MSGPSKGWTNFPNDGALGDQSFQCLQWMVAVCQAVQPALFPPQTPMLTTISYPGAIHLVWNEVVGASSYALFETATQTAPPGVPLTTVPANVGAISNAWMRPNVNDTVTRYYSIIAIAQNNRSAISAAVPGVALASGATLVPASGTPVNQGGVGGGTGGGGGITGLTSRIPGF